MRVKFWGVRGSVPTPLLTDQYQDKLFSVLQHAQNINLNNPLAVREFILNLPPHLSQLVGGNTTCIEINLGDELVIIDCGSGMRPLGVELMSREFGRGHGMAHIFFTHAHWDHLQGLPFFAPLYVPGNHFVFYAVNHSPYTYLAHQQTAPTFFPVPVEALPARLEFVQIEADKPIQIAGTTIRAMPLYHPGVAHAYRFENRDGVFVFASDGEYQMLDEENIRQFLHFFQDADALVFDTQYSLRDVLLSRVDWGHSSAMIGVDMAERANIKRLYTFHYDHADGDKHIYEVAEAAQIYADITPIESEVQVKVAYEGLELFIGADPGLSVRRNPHPKIALLTLAGRLYADTAAALQPHLDEALSAANHTPVLIDLADLTWADPAGALALVQAVARQPGAKVAFVAATPVVRRALDRVAAATVGAVYYRRQHAFAALLGAEYLQLDLAVLEGCYTLGEVLAADESGATFHAVRLADGQRCAVHVHDVESEMGGQQQFAELARSWQALQHPHLLPVYEVLETGHHVICISALPPDTTAWHDWLSTHQQRMSLITTLESLEQMLHALNAVHSAGIVHGALRPECIVLSDGALHISLVPLTSTRTMPASSYRSPEQLCGAEATRASDIFSLGVLWYEALVGIHPFSAEIEEMVLAQQLRGTPLTLRVFRPDLSAAVEQFFSRLLSADPEQRFGSTTDVLHALPALMRASAV